MVRVLSARVGSVAGSAQASGAAELAEPLPALEAAPDEDADADADPADAEDDAVSLPGALLVDAVLFDAVSVEEPHAASSTTSDDPAASSKRR